MLPYKYIFFINFKGLLSSVKKEEIVRFKAYLAEYGMTLGRQQSAKVIINGGNL